MIDEFAEKRPGARNLRCNVTFNWGCMYVHNYSGKHFTLYVKNNFRIVLFYSCVFYILLYIYISSLKNPLKLASKRLAKCSYCQSFIFKKIYDPPPWGHPISVGPGAAWSKLTPLPVMQGERRDCRQHIKKLSTSTFCLCQVGSALP
jgi:hypothetical protein